MTSLVLGYCVLGLAVLAAASFLGVVFALSLKGALAMEGKR